MCKCLNCHSFYSHFVISTNDEVIDVAEPVCTARVAKGSQELRGFPDRRSFSGKPGTDPFRQTTMVDHPSEDSTL